MSDARCCPRASARGRTTRGTSATRPPPPTNLRWRCWSFPSRSTRTTSASTSRRSTRSRPGRRRRVARAPRRARAGARAGRGRGARGLAQEIRRAMKRYPEKRSPRSRRSGPSSAATDTAAPGDQPGRGGDGSDPGLPAVGRELLRPLPARAAGRARGAGLHQHLLLAARRRPAAGLVHGRRRSGTPGTTSEDGKVFVRGFECLGACDLAPMASIDERYYPLDAEDAADAVEGLRKNERNVLRRSGSRTARPPGASGPVWGPTRASRGTR